MASRRRLIIPGTRAEAVADELRRLIEIGELGPGMRLRQADIARRLGVSTTPVREAFTALASDGLLRQNAHRGAIVFSPSLDELQQIYEIRIALEPLATEFASKQLTDSELKSLRGLVDEMGATADPHRYAQLNREFHAGITAAAHRPRLGELIDSLRTAASTYMQLIEHREDPVYRAEGQAEHEEIMAILERRAAKRAGRAMAEHLRHSMNHIALSVFEDAPQTAEPVA